MLEDEGFKTPFASYSPIDPPLLGEPSLTHVLQATLDFPKLHGSVPHGFLLPFLPPSFHSHHSSRDGFSRSL